MDDERAAFLGAMASQMRDKQYRDHYVENFSRQLLAEQMRQFRGDLTQAAFGKLLNRTQSQIARFEDPRSGWQTRTVFDMARSQNMAAITCFIDFETFFRIKQIIRPADASLSMT
jgi:hypothetical protein